MPPLYEGSLLYMPTALPGISITEATRLLQIQDRILTRFPEVRRVFGSVGRAETSTDNSPMGMVTSTIHVLIITPVIFALMKRRALRRGKLQVSAMRF